MSFDNILVYNTSWESHMKQLKHAFSILQSSWLYAKRTKCTFAVKSIKYLAHSINKGVEMDVHKVEAIKEWPISKIIKDLRNFLGLARYYRKFIKGFGIISKPLT